MRRAAPYPALYWMGAVVSGLGKRKWWLDPGSNRGHTDFQSVALPTELSSHIHLAAGEQLCPIGFVGQVLFEFLQTLYSHTRIAVPEKHRIMPTYIYETIPKKKGAKSKRFEVVQKMKDKPLKKHPKTGEPVQRVITGGCGVVFHGPSIMSMNVPRSRSK